MATAVYGLARASVVDVLGERANDHAVHHSGLGQGRLHGIAKGYGHGERSLVCVLLLVDLWLGVVHWVVLVRMVRGMVGVLLVVVLCGVSRRWCCLRGGGGLLLCAPVCDDKPNEALLLLLFAVEKGRGTSGWIHSGQSVPKRNLRLTKNPMTKRPNDLKIFDAKRPNDLKNI